jgi:hypothetical protein
LPSPGYALEDTADGPERAFDVESCTDFDDARSSSEVKAGLIDSPAVKFTVGYTFS